MKIWWMNIPSIRLVCSSGWRDGQHGWRVVCEEKSQGRCTWQGRQHPDQVGLMVQVGSLDVVLIAWEALLGCKQGSESV